jgi:hypothetical protein
MIAPEDGMDTDELTEMAYDTILLAHEALDVLSLEIGASAKDYLTEDEFLRGTLIILKDILADPESYLDSWNYFDTVNPKRFGKGIEILMNHVEKTLNTPLHERGKTVF